MLLNLTHFVLFCSLVQVGVLGLSLYNVTNNILRMKAWYALFVYGLVPLGVIFFSFAAGCAIKGIFSLIMGGTLHYMVLLYQIVPHWQLSPSRVLILHVPGYVRLWNVPCKSSGVDAYCFCEALQRGKVVHATCRVVHAG